jgi:hypothetical protein
LVGNKKVTLRKFNRISPILLKGDSGSETQVRLGQVVVLLKKDRCVDSEMMFASSNVKDEVIQSFELGIAGLLALSLSVAEFSSGCDGGMALLVVVGSELGTISGANDQIVFDNGDDVLDIGMFFWSESWNKGKLDWSGESEEMLERRVRLLNPDAIWDFVVGSPRSIGSDDGRNISGSGGCPAFDEFRASC